MKISPIAAPTNGADTNIDLGKSAGADRVARAKAVLEGKPTETTQTQAPQEKEQANVKRIKMRTQRSTNRHETPAETIATDPATPVEAAAPVVAQTDNPANVEQGQSVEATNPIDPQAAAIAKVRRAEQLIKADRAKLEAEKADFLKSKGTDSPGFSKDQIKANALGILREAGVTNDQLTEALLQEAQDYGPGFSRLENEIKTLKEALEAQKTTQAERDQTTERQVLTQIRKDVDALVANGEEFELVRSAGFQSKVVELIHKTFQKTGEVMDTLEATQLLEDELLSDSLKFAALKKVQNKISPPQPQPTAGVERKTMKTLTNRDGLSSLAMSKRDRAIAAMEGRLK